MRYLSRFLFLIGLFLIAFASYLTYQRTNPNVLAFNIDYIESQNHLPYQINQATELIIPTQDIQLPIYLSSLKDGKWQVTSKGVSILDTTPVPGQKGNSVIYGHNWPKLLGNLTKVKPGDLIVIKYEDQTTKKFEVEYTQIVSPSDISVLKPSDKKIITIYTCTGFLDSKRFVVTASLVE